MRPHLISAPALFLTLVDAFAYRLGLLRTHSLDCLCLGLTLAQWGPVRPHPVPLLQPPEWLVAPLARFSSGEVPGADVAATAGGLGDEAHREGGDGGHDD